MANENFALVMQMARMDLSPYTVKQSRFKRMQSLYFTNFRTGKMAGNPIVHHQ